MLQLLLPAILLHPVHETVSEIQWNAETKRLEIALRIDVLDEQWLRKNYARNEKDLSRWATSYLRKYYRVTPVTKAPATDATLYHWVGRQAEGAHAWWFFEIAPADGRWPRWIDVRVLFQRQQNYVHRILILGQVPRRSLELTIDRPRANLDPFADELNDATTERAPSESDPSDGKRDGGSPTDRGSHLDW